MAFYTPIDKTSNIIQIVQSLSSNPRSFKLVKLFFTIRNEHIQNPIFLPNRLSASL